MNEQKRGFRYWFVAGIGLGVGFWLISLAVSVLILLTSLAIHRRWFEHLSTESGQAETYVLKEAGALTVPKTRVVTVPPRKVSECLKKTGGVANRTICDVDRDTPTNRRETVRVMESRLLVAANDER